MMRTVGTKAKRISIRNSGVIKGRIGTSIKRRICKSIRGSREESGEGQWKEEIKAMLSCLDVLEKKRNVKSNNRDVPVSGCAQQLR